MQHPVSPPMNVIPRSIASLQRRPPSYHFETALADIIFTRPLTAALVRSITDLTLFLALFRQIMGSRASNRGHRLLAAALLALLPLGASGSTDSLMIDPAKNPHALARLFVKMPKPDYPPEARQKHITGYGIFDVSVRPRTGLVTHVAIFRSTGSKVLDDAAVRTLLRWQTRPGVVRGLRVPLSFSFEPPSLIYVTTCGM